MKENAYSDLYFLDSVDKQIVIEVVGTGISIDNSMIEQGTFSLTETLCSQSELKFGICEANRFTVIVHDMPRSIKGETVVVREYLDGHMDNPFPYGIYKVNSDVPTSDRTKREITAYDAMYDIITADVKSWYAGLLFPMTLRQFRDSFFAHFGITQKETTLVNDGMTVNKTLVATQTDPDSTIAEESTISGKTVIEAICEINGVFGNINRDGEFEYIELKEIISPLYPANDLYPSNDLFPRDPNTISMTGHYITFDYEDFQTKQITQLEIRPSDDSAGAAVGTSGNNYVISGNFLVSDKTGTELEAIAANTLSIIRKASYTPLKSSEVVGNPCIELGDPIRFNTTREIVESYVLQRTLTGIQSKRDSIVSPGSETYKQNPNSIRDQIESVQRRTNKLERTADHTLSELADLDASTTSRFEQTAEQIQTEVSNRQSADSDLSSRITQTADSITTEVANRQSADNEMSSRITQTAEQIQSEVVRATGAESELSSAVAQTAELIETEVINRQSADNEMSSRISQTANEIASEVAARQNADTEMSTKISQTAQAIEAEVSARGIADNDIYGQLALKIANTDDGTIISLINGSADKIHFNANNMFTVTSPNFIVDETGNVEIGGNFVADTRLSLCYDYASLPGIAYASKVDVLNIGGGSFNLYYVETTGKYILVETHTAIGGNSPVLYLGDDDKIRAVITDKQFQAPSIFANIGMFDQIAMGYATGTYGGRVYRCCDSVGDEGIASAGWVKKYVSAEIPNTSNFAPSTHYHTITPSKIAPGSGSGTHNFMYNFETYAGTNGFSYTYGYVTGSLSDIRLKENIRKIEDISDKYMRLVPIQFNFHEDIDCVFKGTHFGFIAQDVSKIFNDDSLSIVCREHQENESANKYLNGDDAYIMDKDELHALHVQMIQRHHIDIESLKQENLALQNKISILEQKMEVLENVINNKINQS